MSIRPSLRVRFLLLAVCAFGLLAGGLILGEVLRLQPCHLCNLQRLCYMVFGVVALAGVIAPLASRVWGSLLALSAAGGVAAAIEQSWMQYAPQSVNECGFGDPTLTEQLINWLGMKWPAMFMVTGFCTQKEWTFLGLSLANWSGLCFLGLLVLSLGFFFRRRTAI